VFLAGPSRYLRCLVRRAARKQLLQLHYNRCLVFAILGFPPGGCAFALPGAAFVVGQTLGLGLLDGLLGDEDALAFIAITGACPLDHNGTQWRMLRGAAREGGIAAGQILEMVKVRTGQAECPVVFHANPSSSAQLVAAVSTFRVAANDENHNILRIGVRSD
jgi:hypothetical protein